jgi:hypothetical protein
MIFVKGGYTDVDLIISVQLELLGHCSNQSLSAKVCVLSSRSARMSGTFIVAIASGIFIPRIRPSLRATLLLCLV